MGGIDCAIVQSIPPYRFLLTRGGDFGKIYLGRQLSATQPPSASQPLTHSFTVAISMTRKQDSTTSSQDTMTPRSEDS